jgi:predicted dehydrogenase
LSRDVSLRQAWPLPTAPRPIVVIGSGAIVQSAHVPAYQRIGLPIAGVLDLRPQIGAETDVPAGVTAFASMADACRVPDAVFDVAVTADELPRVIEHLPFGAAVLIQQPIGSDLVAAARLRSVCRERRLRAAVNFQLRFSPNVLALQDLLQRGTLGEVVDIDVRVVTEHPWHLWTALRGVPRLEVLYHSINYLDVIRALAGEPEGVYCRAVGRADMPDFSDTRSSTILDYGDYLRCALVMNHTYRGGETGRASEMRVEGTQGIARLTMGVNLAYPGGPADTLDVFSFGAWAPVPLRGSWFTEAFEGPMCNLQRYVAGEDGSLVTDIDEAMRTMAVVEACYASDLRGSTPVPPVD